MFLLIDPSVSGVLRISLLATRGKIYEHIYDTRDQSSRSVFHLIIKFFGKSRRSLADIDALGVILGAGSFTSARLSVCAVNTMGWLYDLPVYGFGPGDKIQFKKTSRGFTSFVKPSYSGEPNITFRKMRD